MFQGREKRVLMRRRWEERPNDVKERKVRAKLLLEKRDSGPERISFCL